jgi:hypothetical protein
LLLIESTMRPDHKVDFRRAESIAAEAWSRRVTAGIETDWGFNVAKFIEFGLPLDPKIGRITIAHDTTPSEPPAYVTYRPHRVLHVNRGIWEEMKQGEPEARFIGGHEAGHLVLHDYSAQAFSGDPELQIKYASKEYSAEWQADTFSDYLLLPAKLVLAVDDEDELMKYGVTRELARRRLNATRKKPPLTVINQGDACICGNFFVGSGMQLRCSGCATLVNRFSASQL